MTSKLSYQVLSIIDKHYKNSLSSKIQLCNILVDEIILQSPLSYHQMYLIIINRIRDHIEYDELTMTRNKVNKTIQMIGMTTFSVLCLLMSIIFITNVNKLGQK